MFATTDTRSKGLRKRWPCLAKMGNWAITEPCGLMATPRPEYPWVTVTHQPTGYRACSIPRGVDYNAVLKRFNKLFGGARTVIGVRRKYGKLSKKNKSFARGYLGR
jgi:hypothetical protein